MKKTSKAFIGFLALMISVTFFSCSPATNGDNGGNTPSAGDSTDEITSFAVSETQFKAEQAVLAGYNAIEDKYLTIGTPLTSDVPVTGGTIKTGSYVKIGNGEASAKAKAGKVPVEMKIIFTPESGDEITVEISGSAADNNLSGFTAASYKAKIGNASQSYKTTPGVFIAKDNNAAILAMISSYIIDGKEPDGFKISDSFINGSNPCWIVFRNPSIDSESHKVNFTPPKDGFKGPGFTLDDWAEVSSGNIGVCDTPAYKGDGASLNSRDAMKIGLEYFAYAMSAFYYKEEIPGKLEFSNNGSTVRLTNYREEEFFDSPRTISGTISDEEGSTVLRINVKDSVYGDIVITALDKSGYLCDGNTFAEFTINGESYSYLRDVIYKRAIIPIITGEYLPNVILDAISDAMENGTNDGKYTVNDPSFFGYGKGNGKLVLENIPENHGNVQDGWPEMDLAFSVNSTIDDSISRPVDYACSGIFHVFPPSSDISFSMEIRSIRSSTHSKRALMDFEQETGEKWANALLKYYEYPTY